MKNNSKKEDLQFDTIEVLDLNEEDSDFVSNADAITRINADIEKYDSQKKRRNLQTQEEQDKYEDIEEVKDEKAIEEEIEQLEKEENQINEKKEFLSMLLMFAIGIGVALFLKNFIIINATVPTGSMENTIQIKDNLFGYRLAYLKEEPERGDIIFFYYPDDETQKYVKRIIGLPGEHIYITEGKVYINGEKEPLYEPYLKEEWVKGTGVFEFEIPEDSYLVLGDNRNNSHDSRYWNNSYVNKDKIIGKALYIYYPFNHMGALE